MLSAVNIFVKNGRKNAGWLYFRVISVSGQWEQCLVGKP